MVATLPRTIKPLLKWAGNKQGTPIADRVVQLAAPYKDTHTWIEPFCGVLGMALSVVPKQAVLVDAAPEIIGLHQWVKDGGSFTKTPELVTEETYKLLRQEFQELQQNNPETWGDRFFTLLVWLNRACYNGLWRVNSKGSFNVPVGKNSKGEFQSFAMPDLAGMRSVLQSSDWYFHRGDFQIELRDSRPTLFYCDPPYFGTHSSYTRNVFTWQDQKRLAYWLSELNCPVIASNSNNPDIIELYTMLGFQIELIPVRRSISSNGDRQPAVEILATKGF